MSTAAASFIAGTILLFTILAAAAMGWGVSVLATMAGGETWSGTAGVAAFFVTIVATLIIDDRRPRISSIATAAKRTPSHR